MTEIFYSRINTYLPPLCGYQRSVIDSVDDASPPPLRFAEKWGFTPIYAAAPHSHILSRCRTLLPPNFFTPQGGEHPLEEGRGREASRVEIGHGKGMWGNGGSKCFGGGRCPGVLRRQGIIGGARAEHKTALLPPPLWVPTKFFIPSLQRVPPKGGGGDGGASPAKGFTPPSMGLYSPKGAHRRCHKCVAEGCGGWGGRVSFGGMHPFKGRIPLRDETLPCALQPPPVPPRRRG